MKRSVPLVPLIFIASCSNLRDSREAFADRIATGYPVGSPVQVLERDLERFGFQRGEADFSREDLPSCMVLKLAYGFWGGGERMTCYRAGETGIIEDIAVIERVAFI